MPSLHAYVLSLPAAVERREVIGRALAECGLEHEFVDGLIPDTDAYALWSYLERQRPHIIRRVMRVQEASCTLGHVKILTKFLTSNHRHALVFEDDALVEASLPAWVAAFIEAFGEDYHLAKIGSLWADPVRGRLVSQITGHNLIETDKPKAGTHAIIYSREGALRVLDAARIDALPYDYLLRRFAGWRFRVFEADPTVVSVGSVAEQSYIDNDASPETGRLASVQKGTLIRRIHGRLSRLRAKLGKATGY